MRRVVVSALMASAMWADSLNGKVTDPQGAAIGGAKVSVYARGSTAAKMLTTDANGVFRLDGIVSGAYLVEVESDGFRPYARTMNVKGAVAEAIRLEVGGVANSVLVTAEGSAMTIDQTAKAITVIEGDEIRARNEFSLTEILRNTPGVQIRNQGGPGQFTQFRMRGLRTDASQVLIDGLRFRDASTTQGDATSFASALNFVNLGRVEVMRGSGSSLYGTGAVGGSINLVSEQGGGATHGDIQMEGGGLGLVRGRASMGGGFFENRLVYSGGFSHLNVMSGVDGNDRNRSTGGQGFVRFDLTPRLHLSNRYYASDDFAQTNISAATTGIPAANFPASGIIPVRVLPRDQVRVLNAGGRPNYGNATLVPGRDDPDAHRDTYFWTNALTLRQDLSPWASWSASHQRVKTERIFANGAAGVGFQPPLGFSDLLNPVGAIDTVDLRANLRPTRWMQFTGGYEFERERYQSFSNNLRPGNSSVRARTDVVQRSNAAYFQNQLSLLANRLQISLSGRVQAFALDRPTFVITGANNSYNASSYPAPPRAFTGDAAVAYFVSKTGTKLRAHLGNSYRAPSLYERFGVGFFANAASGQVNFTPYGDPGLNPDRYNSFDWGVDQYLLRERVRLSVTHFYTRIKNISQFDFSGLLNPRTDPFGRSSGYINGSGGISRGVEVSMESRPTSTLTLSGSYTYTNSDADRDLVIPRFFRALNVPSNQWSMVASQRLGKRFDVTFDLFRSGTYFINYFAGTGTRGFEFPGFTKADIVGGYKFWTQERKSARFYGKVENVFNREIYEQGVLNPKAWMLVGLSYQF